MASIRILKINFKTNIRGFKQNTYEYSLLNYNPSPVTREKMNNIQTYMPPNTLFFTDTTEIKPKDLGIGVESVLNTLTDDDRFERFLTQKYKENVRKNFGVYKPLTIAQANDMRVVHNNIKVILDTLFAQKSTFYLTLTRPFTVMNYVWNPRLFNERTLTYNGTNFKEYSVTITLKLNPNAADRISDVEYKQSDCFNRKELIKQNFSHVFGDGTYLMKSPRAISAPIATPSMLPGPGNTGAQQIKRPPMVYYPAVRGYPVRGGGKSKKRGLKRKSKTKKK